MIRAAAAFPKVVFARKKNSKVTNSSSPAFKNVRIAKANLKTGYAMIADFEARTSTPPQPEDSYLVRSLITLRESVSRLEAFIASKSA